MPSQVAPVRARRQWSPSRLLASVVLTGPSILFATVTDAAVTIMPTAQTRTISVATSSTSVNEPRFGCSVNATDSEQDDAAAPGVGLFEQERAVAAATPCTNATANAAQESNTLLSSLLAIGSASSVANGFGIGSSAFGESESLFNVAFNTSASGPFQLEGYLSAFGCCFASSKATVTLQTGAGLVIFSETALSSPVGGEDFPVNWSGNLPAGSYRLIVSAESATPSSDGGGSSSATFEMRLVACDPWCAPPNDECAGAIEVGEGSHLFSNINATDSGAYPACANAQDDEIRSDIWYRVTADCSGTMTVSTCDGTSLDTKIGVYQGGACPVTPANLVLLGCNDDACGVPSSVTVPVLIGQQFLVRIGGYQGVQGSGTFDVSYDCNLPNDVCSGAVAIGLGETAFTTLPATTGAPAVPGCGTGQAVIAADIWFDFLSPCTGPIEVSTCGTVSYDSKIAVYDSCPGAGDLPLACNDDAVGCNLASKLSFMAVGGSTYRIRVGGFQPNAGPPSVGGGLLTLTCNGLLGDLDGDGDVDGADLGILLASWGDSDAGDLNGDGLTDGADLGLLLSGWTG